MADTDEFWGSRKQKSEVTPKFDFHCKLFCIFLFIQLLLFTIQNCIPQVEGGNIHQWLQARHRAGQPTLPFQIFLAQIIIFFILQRFCLILTYISTWQFPFPKLWTTSFGIESQAASSIVCKWLEQSSSLWGALIFCLGPYHICSHSKFLFFFIHPQASNPTRLLLVHRWWGGEEESPPHHFRHRPPPLASPLPTTSPPPPLARWVLFCLSWSDILPSTRRQRMTVVLTPWWLQSLTLAPRLHTR